jgi:hypothetical protein
VWPGEKRFVHASPLYVFSINHGRGTSDNFHLI